MARGGKREGAGRPKGRKEVKTLAKEQARELLRQMVTKNLEPLVAAMIDSALGLKRLLVRDPKTGKFHRVDDAEFDMALASEHGVYVYTQPPNTAAFTDLMNRALDKPIEPVELRGGFQVDAIAQKLTEARERLFKRQQEQ